MNSNRCSCGHSGQPPDGVAALAADLDALDAENLTGLPVGVRAKRVLALRRLADRLEGHWLKELADLDACGGAGADQGLQAPSTASWLRTRLHMGASAASSAVRTARALFRGPLTQTAQALRAGELSAAHASALAHGTSDLPTHTTAKAEPVLLDAARRLDPPRLRQVIGHLHQTTDPDGADAQAQRRHGRRGLWVAPTWEGMVALQGRLEPEAGQTLLAALEPLARPSDANDDRSGDQRRADALTELARRALEGGQLPQTGGIRPQLLVTVDLDSLLGPGGLGGELGWAGPLSPEACRRLACDAALTRVLVTRGPTGDHDHEPNGAHPDEDPHDEGDLAGRLRTAMALLPPILGGAPSQPLDVGRTSRVITPPNAAPWPSATAAVCSPTASGRIPGARATIWCPGWTAAPPTWPTSPCCAGPITGRSMRGLAADPRARRPPHRHRTPPPTPTASATTGYRLSQRQGR